MQQLTFQPDKSTELSFKLGIAGTSTAPSSVNFILEKKPISLSYAAIKVGDEWKAIIDNPGRVFSQDDKLSFSISVVLNNRVFSPMRGVATILAADLLDVTAMLPKEATLPKETVLVREPELPNEEQTPKVENPQVQSDPVPVKEARIKPKRQSTGSLLKDFEPAIKRKRKKPAAVPEAVVAKTVEQEVPDIKPVQVEAALDTVISIEETKISENDDLKEEAVALVEEHKVKQPVDKSSLLKQFEPKQERTYVPTVKPSPIKKMAETSIVKEVSAVKEVPAVKETIIVKEPIAEASISTSILKSIEPVSEVKIIKKKQKVDIKKSESFFKLKKTKIVIK